MNPANVPGSGIEDRMESKRREANLQAPPADTLSVATTTAAGVWILATVSSFGTWFFVAILFFSELNRSNRDLVSVGYIPSSDPSGIQYLLAIAFAVILTVASWSVARRVVG